MEFVTRDDTMPRLISIRDAADTLGCDPRTVRRYISARHRELADRLARSLAIPPEEGFQ